MIELTQEEKLALNKKYQTKCNVSNMIPKPEFISVEKAKEYLKHNLKNYRRVNRRHMLAIADDILSGQWRIQHAGIAFDTKGKLCDGQHRLFAIIISGVGVPIVVSKGVPVDSIIVMDSNNLKRTAANYLTFKGEKKAKTLAASLTHMNNYDLGRSFKSHDGGRTPNSLDILWKKYTGMDKSVDKCTKHEMQKVIRASVASFCHYVFSRKDPKSADVFFERLQSGICSKTTDPIRLLRDHLIDIKMNRKEETDIIVCAVFVTWNSMRSGKSLSKKRLKETIDLPNEII